MNFNLNAVSLGIIQWIINASFHVYYYKIFLYEISLT